mmetsp:Transcript_34694/g.79499  ORF Transcript_34694/g.79499 Transcript_34694/m.79499 type:complete len:135 (+) Transcript_34694:69-473(+)
MFLTSAASGVLSLPRAKSEEAAQQDDLMDLPQRGCSGRLSSARLEALVRAPRRASAGGGGEDTFRAALERVSSMKEMEAMGNPLPAPTGVARCSQREDEEAIKSMGRSRGSSSSPSNKWSKNFTKTVKSVLKFS